MNILDIITNSDDNDFCNAFTGYANGYEFYEDLVTTYGKEEALTIANNYLDLQAHINNGFPDKSCEEFIFCKELYTATKR